MNTRKKYYKFIDNVKLILVDNIMNLTNYIKKYFARFPNKKYMILKGDINIMRFLNKMESKNHQDILHDFSKKPILSNEKNNDIYLMICKSDNNCFNIQMLYNYKQNKEEMPLRPEVMPISISYPEKPPMKPEIMPINITIEEKPTIEKPPMKPEIMPISISNPEKPILEDNNTNQKMFSELGYGILGREKMNIHFMNQRIMNSNLSFHKGKFMYYRNNMNETHHGYFQIISYALFEQETNIKIHQYKEDKYTELDLYFTYYDSPGFVTPTYGTHYCLDENAVEWKIDSGPDFGSYAFSIPPFPDCDPKTTPASFIFSLSEDDYLGLKNEGKKDIRVKTSVMYKMKEELITKKIEFVLKIE